MSNILLPMNAHTLVVAEKPSVGQTIAAVIGAKEKKDGFLLGNGWIVTWCVGHLVELAMPQDYDERYAKWTGGDLPILPDPWQYVLTEKGKKQFFTLKELMNAPQVESIVCATDAGREGELIFRLVYHQCHCNKPVKRLWISSLEETAIREGFQHLHDSSEYDRLYEAALCRQKADWLVGINASRLYSLIYGTTLNIGRVMTPTLNMLRQREQAIEAFQPEKYHTVHISCGFLASGERISDPEEAKKIAAACSMKAAYVRKVDRKQKKENPPRLYDLTTLQRDANRIFGYTAQQTLDYAQDLYEKKMITYPRTDSQFLTEDMRLHLTGLVHMSANCLPYVAGMPLPVHEEQVIDNAKVSDHHAIIPTKTMGITLWLGLPSQEKTLLELICVRLICAVSDPYEYAETVVTVECEGHTFTGKGKTVSQIGWKLPFELFTCSRKQGDSEDADNGQEPQRNIRTLEIGEKLYPVMSSVKDGVTAPPKHYTEDSLLAAMETAGMEDLPEDAERKGLGTPATRAGILEKLVQAGLVARRGSGRQQNLLPTGKGKALIAVTPDILKSPLLTAEWEQRLKAIEHGAEEPAVFLAEIADLLKEMCKEGKPVPDAESIFPSKRERIGSCPACGAPVAVYPRGFFCENRICPFAIWKDNRFFTTKKKNVTKELVSTLLEKKQADLTELYSEKTGKLYNAQVLLETDQDGRARFRLEYPQRGQKKDQEVAR